MGVTVQQDWHILKHKPPAVVGAVWWRDISTCPRQASGAGVDGGPETGEASPEKATDSFRSRLGTTVHPLHYHFQTSARGYPQW